MRRLQLYIGTERVDLFKDESVSLTQTIKNVKDLAKVFTEFTQTFSVPASSVNNKIFQHYYNFDISGGFDARIKADARLELNDLPFKDGKIALQGVELKNNLAHTYKITFFGNTVNLKDILGEAQNIYRSGLGREFFPTSTVVPFADQTRQALELQQAAALEQMAPSAMLGQAANTFGQFAGSPMSAYTGRMGTGFGSSMPGMTSQGLGSS
jgi:hypothetical protein